MIIYTYSQVSQGALKSNIGLPQYSYYFVLEKFLPVLKQIGTVVPIDTPEALESLQAGEMANDEPCCLLSFTPPQDVPVGIACPVFCIFAWEFSNIPDETWDDNPQNNWLVALERLAGAIALSSHTGKVIRRVMGEGYPVTSIPAPLWDRYATLRASLPRPAQKTLTLPLPAGSVIDSKDFSFGDNALVPLNPLTSFDRPLWDGNPIQMDFFDYQLNSGLLCGFYDIEPWGAWSRLPSPWVVLSHTVFGKVILEFEAAGFGANAGHTIDVSIGGAHHQVTLSDNFQTLRVEAELVEPANLVTFGGLKQVLVGSSEDHRTLGMALRWVRILKSADEDEVAQQKIAVSPPEPRGSTTLQLEGVVYTSLLNPVDQRKNWVDMVSAFCHAFREVPDAVLVLKMSHRHLGSFLGKLMSLLEQIQPFQCRVVALHGYMEDETLNALMASTTYYANASLCEGLCMPLMEFMSAGVPALATRNTAMEDYISPDAAFIVESSPAPTIWPQDPRIVIRTLQYRVSWESLEQQFRESYRVAKEDLCRYRALAHRSLSIMSDYCADDTVMRQLSHFIKMASSR